MIYNKKIVTSQEYVGNRENTFLIEDKIYTQINSGDFAGLRELELGDNLTTGIIKCEGLNNNQGFISTFHKNNQGYIFTDNGIYGTELDKKEMKLILPQNAYIKQKPEDCNIGLFMRGPDELYDDF